MITTGYEGGIRAIPPPPDRYVGLPFVSACYKAAMQKRFSIVFESSQART